MDSLPYRATIFLRPAGRFGETELMERMFATDADAVRWCQIMTEAQLHATGRWMVARVKGGRMLALVREQGLPAPAEFSPVLVLDDASPLMAEAGLMIEPALLDADPMQLLVAV